ncbi:MAG TPA: histidine kinase [Anaerolineales bacterium]|nr:histidine kinase [Anaerolineales bacterium]
MSSPMDEYVRPIRPSRIALIATYLIFTAVVLRTLTYGDIHRLLPYYLPLELIYILLFTTLFWKPHVPAWSLHLYFALQSTLVWIILSLFPEFDFIIVLFLLLSYQASLFFAGKVRRIWIIILALLTGGPLMLCLGLLRGLALSLTTMASEIVILSYVIVSQETEAAEQKSQALLNELQSTHRQLQSYMAQVEEMATLEERNRLARELHDTVSQLIFTISLTSRSAQILLEREPARVGEQINSLQHLSSTALSELRSLITQLRPEHSNSPKQMTIE